MFREKLTYILTGLFILLIIFFLSGLYLIRSSIDLEHQRVLIASKIEKLLDRKVIIGNIDFSFYPPVSLKCENFVILEKNSDQEFFSAREVYLVLDSIALLNKEIRWKDIRMSHPVLNIRRLRDGNLNISDFYIEGKDGTRELKKEITELALISQFSFRNGELWFHGVDMSGRHSLTGLKGINFFATREQSDGAIRVSGSAQIAGAFDGSALKIKGAITFPQGNFDIGKFNMDMDISLYSFDLQWIRSYVAETIQSPARLEGKGKAEVVFRGNPFSSFSCSINALFNDFYIEGSGFSYSPSGQTVLIKSTLDRLDERRIRVKSLEVKGKNIRIIADADGMKDKNGWLWTWRLSTDILPLREFLATFKSPFLEKEPFSRIRESLMDGSMRINSLTVISGGQKGINVPSGDIEIMKSVFNMGRGYDPLRDGNGRITVKNGIYMINFAGLWGKSRIEEVTAMISSERLKSMRLSLSIRATFPLSELGHLLNHDLLPEDLHEIGKRLPPMEGWGKGSFKLNMGSGKKVYLYRGEIEIGSAKVSFPFLPLMLTNIKGVLGFDNGSLNFRNGYALYGSTPLEGYLIVKKHGNQFQLKKVNIFIKNGYVKDLVEFSKYLKRYRSTGSFSGTLEWSRGPQNEYLLMGEINFSKVGLTTDPSGDSEPSYRINGKVGFRGREGFIRNCVIDFGKELIRCSGTFSLNSEYVFRLYLKSTSIDLDRIINDAFIDFIKGSQFLENIRLHMDLDFKNSSFRSIELKDLDSMLEYRHNTLRIRKLSASVFDGIIDLSGHINFGDQVVIPWEFHGELKNGNMQKLMELTGKGKSMGGRFSITGVVNGINFDRESFRTLNGFLYFSMNNGFLNIGKFKIATDIISYLKNLEWAKMRLPGFSGNGLGVKKMTADFLINNGKAKTTNLKIDGDGLRITGKGEIGLYDRTMDVSLGIHPFPLMDKAIGSIPIIGRVITGEDRSILGFSFRIKGEWGNPQISSEGQH